MPANLTRILQDDFSAGMNRDVAPQLIDPRGVYDLLNGLLDDDGSIYRRGGTVSAQINTVAAPLRFLWRGYLKPGARTVEGSPSSYAVLDPVTTQPLPLGAVGSSYPAPAVELGGLLFLPNGVIYGGSLINGNYSTGTVTTTNGSKTVTGAGTNWVAGPIVDAGMLFRVGSGERVYVVKSIDSTTSLTLEDAYEGTTGGGKAYSLSNVLDSPGPPYQSSSIYWTCANRLVSAAGNRVSFGAIDNPHVAVAANDHRDLPEGVRILGGATIGLTSLIFTTNGIWTLDGLAFSIVDSAGNPQHRLQLAYPDLVLLSASGIASWEGRLLVPCLDGIWLLDGVSAPVKVSRPIDKLYRSYVESGCRAGGAAVYRGHLLFPVLAANGSQLDLLVCRLDRPVRTRGQITYPWSRFDGQGGTISAFAVSVGDPTPDPTLLGALNADPGRVLDCSGFFDPDVDVKNDADGTTQVLRVVPRDYNTGSLNENTVRRVRARYELIDAADDNPTLSLDYATGARISGASVWNHFKWNQAKWSAPDGTDYNAVVGQAPEDDGTHPFTWYINRLLRFIRLRLTSSGPAAKLTLRSLEIFVRPSRKL